MGTKGSHHSQKNSEENLSVPPGFVSLTSFTLKKIIDNGSQTKPGLIDTHLSNFRIEKLKASFRRRPLVPHDKVDSVIGKTETEDSGRAMKCPSSPLLPKGVVRGCAECHDCVTVTARWHPEEACFPVLDEAPVFHPTEEEFKDTLKYIAAIRPKAEGFGICRIVPPSSWKPPCLLRDKNTWKDSKFRTHVQKIDGLLHVCLKRKLSGMSETTETKKPNFLARMGSESCDNHILGTEEAKCTFLSSKYESGPEFSLQSFKSYADSFKRKYFCSNDKVVDPNVESTGVQELQEPLIARVEGEYWRMINNPSDEIEVLFVSNLETQTLGSGFPIEDSPTDAAELSEYLKTGWNLNNTPSLSGSLLPFGCDSSSDILIPKLSIGMCFSTRCWRKEEHHLYSLCYMHLGEPKVWYAVPGRYCFKFVEVIKKLLPQLSRHPALLHELVMQLSPSTLTAEGIPVYHCVQNPLEFVLIFPGTYHSEFDAGFNCSEAVCFAPFDWLPHGQNIVELYSNDCRKTSISHDRLLIGAAKEAVNALWQSCVLKNNSSYPLWRSVCGKNGILAKALKSRVNAEDRRREHIYNLARSRKFDGHSATKRECIICSYDLYLSAVSCSCSPNSYACARHSEQLCACAWGDRYYLFRFEIEELKRLVEALGEENLKAIHFWAKKKIQPLSDPFVSKDALSEDGDFPGAKEDNGSVKPTFLPVSEYPDTNVGGPSEGGESKAVYQSVHNVIVLSDDED